VPGVNAPSGTVTFLFTDIEGSTRRWERARVAMADALERHDDIVREAVEARGGYVFKTVGDEFCCAFPHAPAAVDAAIAIQQALGAQDFRAVDGIAVRAAIHTGAASERGGDYFGPPVNRVARLLALAHGGQVLLSGPAAELLREDLPDGLKLIDLGEYPLKDLVRLERVHQLQAPGLRAAFPPLRSAGVIPNNLPEFSSTFVGREREVAEIGALLESTRGVTLWGTGGIGKTRCALVAAKAGLPSFRHGVWFVELSSVASGEGVAATVAAALGLAPTENVLDALCARLRTQYVLLVLDNCEHLLSHVTPLVEALLQRCPSLRILATSREPLGYRGEILYHLPSLSLPAEVANLTIEAALGYDSVALFVARAREVDATFGLTSDNLPTVLSIVRRLDGIALALELAANRLRVISLDQMAAGLRERFALLTGGSRTALPRQKTLRALIDWSYELLGEPERRLFCSLSVFAGGFTLDACATVCADVAEPEHEILDLLGALVDKSLVVAPSASGSRGERRYRQIETLREYAAEKLAECGGTENRMAALTGWALELVEAAHAQWPIAATGEWEARFKPEIENVRAALEWALERRADVALGGRLAARARRMLGALAPVDGLHFMELALRAEGLPPEVKAELTLGLAQMAIALRRTAAALANARAAIDALGGPGPEEFVREAQIVAGYAETQLGRAAEAKVELEAAQAYFERAQLLQFCGVVANDLGITHMLAEEFAQARASFDRALQSFRRMKNERGIRAVVINLAELDFQAGDVESAIDRISFEVARNGEAHALMLANLAAYLIAANRFEAGLEYARESLTAAQAAGREFDALLSLQHVAAAMLFSAMGAARERDWSSLAGQLIGYVDGRLTATGSAREYTDRREYERLLIGLRQTLDPAKLEMLFSDGASWDDRAAIAAAMTLGR
jgi:predicted ATPase/class 3 adenylate cyclase